MESYNFWQDFFDTYQSLADWIKALWVAVPPIFTLAFIWLLALIWNNQSKSPPHPPAMLIYSICRQDADAVQIFCQFPEPSKHADSTLLNPSSCGPSKVTASSDNIQPIG